MFHQHKGTHSPHLFYQATFFVCDTINRVAIFSFAPVSHCLAPDRYEIKCDISSLMMQKKVADENHVKISASFSQFELRSV